MYVCVRMCVYIHMYAYMTEPSNKSYIVTFFFRSMFYCVSYYGKDLAPSLSLSFSLRPSLFPSFTLFLLPRTLVLDFL